MFIKIEKESQLQRKAAFMSFLPLLHF